MVVTWRLWQHLKNPPSRDYIFRRFFLHQQTPKHLLSNIRLGFRLQALIGLGMVGLCYLSLWGGTLILAGFPIMLFVGIFVLPLFGGVFYGLTWGLSINAFVARQRAAHNWELLMIVPTSGPTSAWSVIAGPMYFKSRFSNRQQRHEVFLGMFTLLAAFLGLTSLEVALTIFAILIASYIDYRQTIALGGVLGIYTALTTRSYADAQLWFVLSYAAINLATYALVAALGFFSGSVDGTTGTLIVWYLLLLVVFAALREVVLWALVERLSADHNIDLLETALEQ